MSENPYRAPAGMRGSDLPQGPPFWPTIWSAVKRGTGVWLGQAAVLAGLLGVAEGLAGMAMMDWEPYQSDGLNRLSLILVRMVIGMAVRLGPFTLVLAWVLPKLRVGEPYLRVVKRLFLRRAAVVLAVSLGAFLILPSLLAMLLFAMVTPVYALEPEPGRWVKEILPGMQASLVVGLPYVALWLPLYTYLSRDMGVINALTVACDGVDLALVTWLYLVLGAWYLERVRFRASSELLS